MKERIFTGDLGPTTDPLFYYVAVESTGILVIASSFVAESRLVEILSDLTDRSISQEDLIDIEDPQREDDFDFLLTVSDAGFSNFKKSDDDSNSQ